MASLKTSTWNLVLQLAIYRDGELDPCGTAFLVGPSLALTATHVVPQPPARDGQVTSESAIQQYGLVALQRIVGRSEALPWKVDSVSTFPVPADADADYDYSRAIDISLLKLAPLEPVNAELDHFRQWFFELNVAPPSVGSKIMAYGYADSRIDHDPSVSNGFLAESPKTTVQGTVTETAFPYRDRNMFPSPCFEVRGSGDFESGMSGGPIFNERNQVCGVISTGGLGASYGSVLWPALGIQVDDSWRLIDLAQQRTIRAANHHCVEMNRSDLYTFPGISFDPTRAI